MKKKLIVLSILMGIALIGLIGTTVAWLTSTGKEELTFEMGEVKYSIEASDTTTDKIVPGQNIFSVGTIKLTNSSNVDSQVRIIVSVKHEGTEMDANLITMEADSNWTLSDGYWYYKGTEGVIEAVTNPTDIAFPISVVLNGTAIGNDYANDTFTVTLTFEAKQADHVVWSDMGSIDFSTGLAKTN